MSTKKPEMPGTLSRGAGIEHVAGLAPEDRRIVSAVETATRLQRIAGQAAKELPFETEPAEFVRLFRSLATSPDSHD